MGLKITQKTIDDYLAWVKMIVGINSAMIAGLFFKYANINMAPLLIKLSLFSFLLSLGMFIALFTTLIEHKNLKTSETKTMTAFVAISSQFSFILGFVLLALNITV